MTGSFPSVKEENILALVQFAQLTTSSELCSVKTTKHDVLIPSGETNPEQTPNLSVDKVPVLFEPNPEQSWPTSLEIPETMTNITGGCSSHVDIQVTRNTCTQQPLAMELLDMLLFLCPSPKGTI